jgi:hypothetical protein
LVHHVGRGSGLFGTRGHGPVIECGAGVGVAIRYAAPGVISVDSWLAAGKRIASVGDVVCSGTVQPDLLKRRDVGVDERRRRWGGEIRSRRHGLMLCPVGGSDAFEHNSADGDRRGGCAKAGQAVVEARELRNGRAGPHCRRQS